MIFDHEKLMVYQKAIHFIAWCDDLFTNDKGIRVFPPELEDDTRRIPVRIAMGNAAKDPVQRTHHFEKAMEAALACAACLDVSEAQSKISDQKSLEGKLHLKDIHSLLNDMIKKSHSDTPSRETSS